MVLLLIRIKCELENLTNLQPEENDFTYYFKLECASCREVSSRESSVTSGETVSSGGGRQKSAGKDKLSDVNLMQKCDFCGRTGTISIVEGHGKPYTAEDSEKSAFVPLVLLDCRGMEPKEYLPKDGWCAQGAESGTKFTSIDLSDGDYSEYDEKAGASVGVYGISSEVVKTKL